MLEVLEVEIVSALFQDANGRKYGQTSGDMDLLQGYFASVYK